MMRTSFIYSLKTIEMVCESVIYKMRGSFETKGLTVYFVSIFSWQLFFTVISLCSRYRENTELKGHFEPLITLIIDIENSLN